ncbi:hypothetical protein AAF712_014826 [Marasmius tenuissimus]|uniref:Uncharacterized protein n=1 Tax=Marasmius tenuissimus TaxID=585030 RepID=A0ABR2ZB86_9AGAR
MANTLISAIRGLIFALATLLSLAALGLCIHAAVILIPIRDFESWLRFFDFQLLGWIAGALTIIMCLLLGIMGLAWRNGPLTKNIVELPVFTVLLVLWLVIGVKTNNFINKYNRRLCNRIVTDDLSTLFKLYCDEFPAIRGISFANFSLFLFYCLLTIVLCIIAKSRDSKRRVWLISASQAHYFGILEPPPPPQLQPPMNGFAYPQFVGPYAPPGSQGSPMGGNTNAGGQWMPYVIYTQQQQQQQQPLATNEAWDSQKHF